MDYNENSVITNKKTRRSVRDYLNKPVPEEIINKIIDAGRYAPSGFNLQPWRFVVVENPAILERLSDYAKPVLMKNLSGRTDAFAISHLERLEDRNYNIFYNAPVLILVIGRKSNPRSDYDCTLCAGNIIHAAHSLGIGSCWVGGGTVIQQSEELTALLQIPVNYKIVAPIILGYPRSAPPTPKKREPVISWVR
ncbi:nitroreductase family protein [Candidatus Methanoperedens nitratireducens]|uniref:nitroreductase family protein n=1 Tax=Candidatus Methanoperedens nitratireducens TaxID=1392998 RepID=UPI0015C6FAE0|nr:nitroreductase family protein [Candidatus Methanoperedens nitroreducens]